MKAMKDVYKRQGIQKLINLPVREKIGRYKYVLEENLDEEYTSVYGQLEAELAEAVGKEGL